MLSGVKTYGCVAILLGSGVVYALGGISADALKGVYAVVGPLAIAALRDAINKMGVPCP